MKEDTKQIVTIGAVVVGCIFVGIPAIVFFCRLMFWLLDKTAEVCNLLFGPLHPL